jgi:hypothetical protein
MPLFLLTPVQENVMTTSNADLFLAELLKRTEAKNDQVKEKLLDILTDQDLQEKADWLAQLIRNRRQVGEELNNLEPDLPAYAEDHSKGSRKVGNYRSQKQMEQIEKLKEELAAMDQALEDALTKNDYSLTKKLIKV